VLYLIETQAPVIVFLFWMRYESFGTERNRAEDGLRAQFVKVHEFVLSIPIPIEGKIMSIEATVHLTFKVDNDTYDVNLSIPAATPTKDAPFKFNVSSGGATPTKLLDVAVGDATHLYVAVAPPQKVLDLIPNGVIQDLDVKVSDGGYDPQTGKFPVA